MRRWGGLRARLAPAVVLVLAGGLTGCADETPAASTGELVYAALGDSFTSGPDIPRIVSRECRRSDRNYPHLVARRLDARLTDVSCGGARTGAVRGTQELRSSGTAQRPQIEAVSSDTDLVTVGLGGNDGGLIVTVVLGCVLLAEDDPDGAPCERIYGRRVTRLLGEIEQRLVSTLEDVAREAPDARTLLVDYPRFLPATGACPRLFPLARGDVDFVRGTLDRLHEAMGEAAEKAGVGFVDVFAASEGHDICSADPWVNGQRVSAGGGATYHPTPEEQEAVARLVLEAR